MSTIAAETEVSSPDRFLPRAVSAGAWALALRIVERGLGLLRTVILARFLAPADFGLFGIALVTLSALETLSQTGFHQALVHRKGDIRPYLDTVWTVQLLRGFALASVLFVAAPTIAIFFGEPAASPLLRALGFGVLLQGAVNVGIVDFQKQLEFRRRFDYQAMGAAAELVASVAAALYFRNAWALVVGYVIGSLVRSVASYVVHPYRPRLRWDGDQIRTLYSFGKWISGSSLIIFLITQGDDILVAKLMGAAALGLYQMAYLLANTPATQVTHLLSEVSFPVYAQIQHEPFRLRAAFFRALETTAFVSLPLAVAIVALAPTVVPLVLGEAWREVVPAMQVLAVCGAIRSIGAANGALYHGTGHPRFDTTTAAIHLALVGILIYPLVTRWGIFGAAVAVTAPMLISQAYGIARACRIIDCSTRDYLVRIVPPLFGSLLAAGVGSGVVFLTSSLLLPAGVVVAGFVYLAFIRSTAPESWSASLAAAATLRRR